MELMVRSSRLEAGSSKPNAYTINTTPYSLPSITASVLKPTPYGLPSMAAANSRFDKYKPEPHKSVRQLKIEGAEDETPNQLKDAWSRLELNTTSEFTYIDAFRLIRHLDYSTKDVEKFSIALAEFQDEIKFAERAGIFLSALINNGKDKNYVVHANHLNVLLDCIGFRNRKNIKVEGSIGKCVGYSMLSGIIFVNGDVGNAIGHAMQGGKIYIVGERGLLGEYIAGGRIYVRGEIILSIGFFESLFNKFVDKYCSGVGF